MQQAARPVAVGLGIGTVGAFWAVKLLRRFLFEVTPGHPVAFGVASALIAIVALGASWLSARRAAEVNPIDVLREN
jgi:ABC-type lipoprotein release transport system permease subunit